MQAYIIKEINQPPFKTEVAIPVPNDDEALVKISASALNHRDVWITKGQYPGIKLGAIMGADGCGTWEGKEYVINPGLDWGSDEAYQALNFRVLGVPDDGTFADYICIPKKYLHEKPSYLTVEEAAALPLAGVTAYRALVVKTKPKAGDKVLISGIGGGVALFAMQYAIALGCDVYVTSGTEDKIEKAISLGAKGGYLYHDAEWPKKLMADIGGVDVVIDSAGGSGFNNLVKVCHPGARISFYGGSLGKIDGLNPQLIFWRQISLLGSTMGSDQDFVDMLAFVDKYKIRPVVDEVLSFDDLPLGFQKMEAGKQFGKIVFKNN
jgi:NADPH:quinone reductase-like Zn-dependent oxidoreductase